MTGFGKAVKVIDSKKITAEIKSLNSKQIDMSVRLPQCYHDLEPSVRNELTQKLMRGKIDISVSCEPTDGASAVSLNEPMLKIYKQQITEIAHRLDIKEPDDWYATLLRLPDAIINDVKASEASESELNAVSELVGEAIRALTDFRKQEGSRLETFFEEKIDSIQQLLNEVPKYEQPRIEKIKARLLDNLQKLSGVDYDKNRFEQELIFYIEKLDITEEKLRLQNHLNYFLDTLHGTEPGQGKKLGFICQEIGREVNTLGSKANQAELQRLVVRMKDHLEQMKEQVLNVL